MSWKSKLQGQILVAASNSDPALKALAHYICDGVDDHVQIRGAIEDAISGALWENTGEVLADKTYSSVWKDGNTYHMYYHSGADGGVTVQIGLATSTDGINFIDQGIVLSPTGGENGVGVPNVWKEDSTWYMIFSSYAATNTICLATSSDGRTWTRSDSNPIISPDALDDGSLLEGCAILKVDSTYYLYFNSYRSTYGKRYISYATSTDLATWTKSTAPPLFQAYRFCPAVFVCDDYYYIMPCHRNTMTDTTGRSSIELWRSTVPTFADKSFVGIVHAATGTISKLDTPSIITDDITRVIDPDDPAEVFMAAKYTGNWGTSRMYESSISEAILRSETLGRTDVRILPGNYHVLTGQIYIDGPIRVDMTGAHIDGYHVSDTYMISVGCPHSKLIGGDLRMLIESGGSGNALLVMADCAEVDTHIQRGLAIVYGSHNILNVACDYGYPFFTFGASENFCTAVSRYGTYNLLMQLGAARNVIILHGKNASATAITLQTNASNNQIIGGSLYLANSFVSMDSTTIGNSIKNLTISGATASVADTGTLNRVCECNGYIARGETKTITGSISTLTENAFNSLLNPYGVSMRVVSLDVYISKAATSTEPNIDCGIGSSATADYNNLFDDLPGEIAGLYRSTAGTPGVQTTPIIWKGFSGNKYLNMSIKGAAATGMVATYVITVMGL